MGPEVEHTEPRLNYYAQADSPSEEQEQEGILSVKRVAHVHKHSVNSRTYLTLITRRHTGYTHP